MKDLFEAIQELFVNVLFAPLDALRALELESWWSANLVSFLFITVGMVAFIYWMLQLKSHHTNGEEDKSVTSHSFL
ncbi:uracil phosphoribosyltransferase [Aurantibacter sp.]|uniref:DUF6341 family protein n=1 Tax=Aurantibacter sp. TaxID=2807103 RepID=UPI0035C7B473